MKKEIFLITFLLLIPFVLAAEERTFTTDITVKTADGTANITTESATNSYNCNNSQTSTFTVSLQREVESYINITCNKELEKLSNTCTNSIMNLSSHIESISNAYSDAKSYYTPYLTCVANQSICLTKLKLLGDDIKELNRTESELRMCVIDKGDVQSQKDNHQRNYNTCNTNLNKEKELTKKLGNQRFMYALIAGVGGALLVWWLKVKRKEPKGPIDKEVEGDLEE